MLSFTNYFSQQECKSLPRFQQSAELQEVAQALENLRCKWARLNRIASNKRPQSKEYCVAQILGAHILKADEAICKFNQSPIPQDRAADLKEMADLTEHLNPGLKIPGEQKRILNGLIKDKNYFCNTTVAIVLVTLPVIPLAYYGYFLYTVIYGFSSLLLAKPLDDFLRSMNAYNEDTESKRLLENYLDCVKRAKASLADALEPSTISNSFTNRRQ